MGPPPPDDDEALPLPLPEDLEPELVSAAVTVIDAEANLLGSAEEAAVMVTADGEGTEAGAV
jgi:hypothetical protein